MGNAMIDPKKHRHLGITDPSPWVRRFLHLIHKGGTVLDLACGGGRHTRLFLESGLKAVALDRDTGPLADLEGHPNVEIIRADLEGGAPWPLEGRYFNAVVVVNYLYRPLFPRLLESVAEGGVFIYETFARGNEAFTKPRNPDHLLKSGELLDLVEGKMQVIAYEHGVIDHGPLPGVVQRICAVKDLNSSAREDGDPAPHVLRPLQDF